MIFFLQYHVNPYYPHFHTGMNPPRNVLPAISPYPTAPARPFVIPPGPRLPPTACHALQHFTLEPEQCRPATVPPIQAIYCPSTRTPSTTSVGHPPPLPTTST